MLRLDSGADVRARALVNAAGPWVSHVLATMVGHAAPVRVRLVKGSHIVVRRLFEHDRCYIFQNADGRICFAIPYETDFTLIGTTDEDYAGDPGAVAPSAAEEAYLCAAVGAYLRRAVEPDDIVWRYAGVRPLRDDGAGKAQETTRDYVLELHAPRNEPPLLSVFGGKITTYRRLAQAALERLAPFFPEMGGGWTAGAALPGGDFPWDGAATLRRDLLGRYPFLPPATAERLIRAYGTRAAGMLGDAGRAADMGQDFGAGLTEREAAWLMDTEWARRPEDILWRRTKLGLRIGTGGAAALGRFMATRGR
jgi:glycerol-3-phosphate dehydrogenase